MNNCFCRITGLQIVAKSSILPAHIGRLVALCCLTGQWAYHPPHGFSLRFHIKARLPLQICIIGGCGCDVVGGQVVGREVESRVATVERISGGCKFQPGWNSGTVFNRIQEEAMRRLVCVPVIRREEGETNLGDDEGKDNDGSDDNVGGESDAVSCKV